MSSRATVIATLAEAIGGLRQSWPLRVAIDGRTASGKTTLADELAVALQATGRAVIRTSIDGFHRPRAERYARGRHSPEGYYHDARDLTAVITLLLAPLGPGGDRRYCTASFDLAADRPITQPALTAPPDAILIVDGTFLQRPELDDGWDLAVFVETTADIAESRGLGRDADQLGEVDAVRELYRRRYRPAYALYDRLCAPVANADVVVGNDDIARPVLRLRQNGRLAPSVASATGAHPRPPAVPPGVPSI
ncbi:uridylate kinase [Bradyrhizobium sp. U87765 SZCCT0131]|uniref:uridylate kinase n=1 Tax=unclassified Bradyrhizobium TaxID=2631580 RepID=UPI001BAB4B99|nr:MULTISPECIES: uridylate kinase [unclassified Bradyrhizobium]MBR1220401.1 uridylate kinase [Bradyrhizobium sp. U87765 SZCCT0131]MBR1263144.1 uridylate kinase [Bradyrhizobium sp. U87765 SZCCT0134]MBR1306973.1 uridylate kinase [Bradyrhizobium sp. U87765 SZCCT0110]MBR1323472.1 uridylate kinase [Bradyrhizobium sp. U87765 SZCCT0109]MBR1345927.1 uridylate kinase [Bradyrhizobium sp. U87765 SZCCT0048]